MKRNQKNKKFISIVGFGVVIIAAFLFQFWGKNTKLKNVKTNYGEKENSNFVNQTSQKPQKENKKETEVKEKKKPEDLYFSFLREELIPEYGLSKMEDISLACEWRDGSVDLIEYLPDENKGILGAKIMDLDQNGVEELIVVCADTCEIDSGLAAYDYDGVRLLLYTIENEKVKPISLPIYASEFPYVFAYGSNQAFDVAIKEKDREKYLVIYENYNYISEMTADALHVIIIQMENGELVCKKYLELNDGYVLNRKDMTDPKKDMELCFDYREGSVNGKGYKTIYEAVSNELEPFGITVSGLESYFEAFSKTIVNEEIDLIAYRGKEEDKFYQSIKEMDPEMECLISVQQKCRDQNVQMIHMEDITKVRDFLGITQAPYGKAREYKRISYIETEEENERKHPD